MATSNSYNFNETTTEVITGALTRLGVIRPGGTVPTNDYNACLSVLNKMIKHWQKIGIHVWAETEGTLFLTSGTAQYNIIGSGNVSGDDVIETTLSASGSGTSLTVVSTIGMTANDQIGIELDDGTRQWTTLVSVDSLTTLTINTALTGAASSSNSVFTYTTESQKPVDVSSCRFRDSSGIDIGITMLGRDEFMAISNKSETGSTVSQVFYTPGRSSGIFYVWPVMTDSKSRIKYSYSRQLQDFDSSSDNPDLPTEWLETLTLNLAIKVAAIYRIKSKEIEALIMDAQRSIQDMQLNDITRGSIQICQQDNDTY